ncbi:MAG: (d)CMP kinase [Chloroflexi bacterium]|nr:(d)CMP kinase [Chloroflexota bacterium]
MGWSGVIAIDGPAASGKSTLGQMLAQKLGYRYFDTGVLYRVVTWLTLQRGIELKDEDGIAHLAASSAITVQPPTIADGRLATVLVDSQDVTWQIRDPEVDARISEVSALPKVREALKPIQRAIAEAGRVVIVGRDIATVIAPDADLKVFLHASPKVRAKRRYLELRQSGQPADCQQTLNALLARDDLDTHRAIAPLTAAPDAVIIDSDSLTPEEELQAALRLLEERQKATSTEN